MQTKLLEVRDSMTSIPVLAIRFDPADETERAMLEKAGYGDSIHTQSQYILIVRLDDCEGGCALDPHSWSGGSRTMPDAHRLIEGSWHLLRTGDVVDIQFEKLETTTKKTAEWLRYSKHPYDKQLVASTFGDKLTR